MIKINRKVEYALIALKHMSKMETNTAVTVKCISDTYKIPFDTTAKAMQLLGHQHIVKASQGIKGGYVLNQDLSQVNLWQLSEIIEGKTLENCESMQCNLLHSCNIKGPLNKLNSHVKNYFEALSLQDFFAEKRI